MNDGYQRIRVLWPDHLGLARGKYVPAGQAGRPTRHCTGTWALGFNRDMTPGTPGSGFFEGLGDMTAIHDPSDIRPGWEEATAVVVADLVGDQGQPVAVSSRAALRRVVERYTTAGRLPQVGLELEAFLMEKAPDGGWQPIDTPGAFVYGTGPAVDPHGITDQLWAAADAAGIEIEAINSEYDNSQFEFTLGHADPLRAADDAFLFKVMARELAARRGLNWTFIGKPASDRGGSGLHINLSIGDQEGTNLINGSAQGGLSPEALHMVGGMLTHHRALCGLCAPTVNAYKRLRPGILAGFWANWGLDHRGATVRVPGERGPAARLEHRLSDGAAPPHIAIAAVLAAAESGLNRAIDPGPAETNDGFTKVSTEVAAPASLGEALDCLEADTELAGLLGEELVAQHLAVKRTEWQRFCEATTDWELNEYLPFL